MENAALSNCSKHERYTRNYDYMEGGDVRIRRLYSRTQWFLTIDEHGVLEMRTVSEGGVLSEKWTKTGREMFLSLSQKGRPLRGKKTRKESIAAHFIPRKCQEDDKTAV